MLKNYGAKFSTHKLLLFDFDALGHLCNKPINLPSNLFHPNDHITFYNLKLQSDTLVSILTYLKSVLFVLKLNLSTMFLNGGKEDESSFVQRIKSDLLHNFESLDQFVRSEVVDSFEKHVYFDYIDSAKQFLANF